jgi:hypothetical protein
MHVIKFFCYSPYRSSLLTFRKSRKVAKKVYRAPIVIVSPRKEIRMSTSRRKLIQYLRSLVVLQTLDRGC